MLTMHPSEGVFHCLKSFFNDVQFLADVILIALLNLGLTTTHSLAWNQEDIIIFYIYVICYSHAMFNHKLYVQADGRQIWQKAALLLFQVCCLRLFELTPGKTIHMSVHQVLNTNCGSFCRKTTNITSRFILLWCSQSKQQHVPKPTRYST